jgi:hypothetical protein
MKNAVFWDVTLCGSCKTDVSEERIASIIRVARIGALVTLFLARRFFLMRNVASYKSHTA